MLRCLCICIYFLKLFSVQLIVPEIKPIKPTCVSPSYLCQSLVSQLFKFLAFLCFLLDSLFSSAQFRSTMTVKPWSCINVLPERLVTPLQTSQKQTLWSFTWTDCGKEQIAKRSCQNQSRSNTKLSYSFVSRSIMAWTWTEWKWQKSHKTKWTWQYQ